MTDRPLINHLKYFLNNNPVPFHTPGHKGRWGEMSASLFSETDIFRADIADDIDGIPMKIRESEKKAAEIYRTRRSLYLVSGSTGGIHTMFLSVLKPGDEVLMGRNMHRAAIEGTILAGVIPRYIRCRMTDEGIPLNVAPVDVKEALKEFPQCRAVYITSPSYFGVCADVMEIGEICKREGRVFLVDEAWGGHFPFHENFPKSAIYSGADIVVQSIHKTLPSLTGSSILHICSSNTDINAVESAKNLVETSSPNLLYYLSLENAINLMRENGTEIYGRAMENADFCRREIQKIIDGLPLRILEGREFSLKSNSEIMDTNFITDSLLTFPADPLKLTIWVDSPDENLTGLEIARIMEEKFGVCAEMAHLKAVQFLFTGFERDGDVERLLRAFKEAVKEIDNMGGIKPHPFANDDTVKKNHSTLKYIRMSPREAYFSKKEKIPLWHSEGSICGEIVTPYPPGIPLLVPGEEISGDIIEHLLEITEAGGCVRGLDYSGDEPSITVVF